MDGTRWSEMWPLRSLSYSFIAELDHDRLQRMRLHPVAIEDCRVRGAEVASCRSGCRRAQRNWVLWWKPVATGAS